MRKDTTGGGHDEERSHLVAGGLLAATPAAAQPPLDPAALELARVLMSRDPTLYDDADTSRIQSRIENLLLAEPGACNAFVAACRGAATEAARQYAEAFRREDRLRRERITAWLLSDTLRPAEMARFAQYPAQRGRRPAVHRASPCSARTTTGCNAAGAKLERMLERTAPGAWPTHARNSAVAARNIPRAAPR